MIDPSQTYIDKDVLHDNIIGTDLFTRKYLKTTFFDLYLILKMNNDI